MTRGLDWRWIAIGTAVMFGLNLVAGLILLPLLGGAVPAGADGAPTADAAAALGGGRLLLAALVSFLSFAIGGYIVGARSPGRTIVEPGISAAIAVAVSLLIGGAFTLGGLLAGGLVPFLAGLLGGWLGERKAGGRPPRSEQGRSRRSPPTMLPAGAACGQQALRGFEHHPHQRPGAACTARPRSPLAPTLASLTDPRKQAAIERDVDEALREEMETGVRHQGRVTANFLALMAFGGAVAAAGLVTEDPERRTIALVAGAATAFALLRLLGEAAAPADVPVPVPPAVAVPDSGPLRRTPTTPMSVGAGRTWRFQKSRLRFGPRLR